MVTRTTHRPPTFHVPEGFHPEASLPMRLLPHCQAACYLMHAIVVRCAYRKGKPANLRYDYLADVVGRRAFEPILRSLLASGDIIRVGGYVVGQQSFAYLPGLQYRAQPLRRFKPTDPGLIDRLRLAYHRVQADQQKYRGPIHDVWEAWQGALRIDYPSARRLIAALPTQSNPYDVQTLMVDRIRSRQYRFIVDPYGRVHNAMTSMHRSVRPSLRIGGERLASVDLVNSQPGLLGLMMKTTIPPQRTKRCSVIMEDGPGGDLARYLDLVSAGRLYESLMVRSGLSRRDVKVGLLCDVCGKRGRYPSPLEDTFRSSFPSVWRFIRRFNRFDHGTLLRELQRIESGLVIGNVGTRLARTDCGPVLSLHDSVFARQADVNTVLRAFEQEFQTLGCRLQVKVAA